MELSGPHTRLLSSLCAECPHSPYGCCVSPPDLDWSDVGRIAKLGGRDFLLEKIAAKDLVPVPHGLRIRRVRRREGPTLPRVAKCVFHGASGCALPPERRPATCNYFLCEDAFGAGGGDDVAARARAERAHARLRAAFEDVDAELHRIITEAHPQGPPWDAGFVDRLGALTSELFRRRPDPLHGAPDPPRDASEHHRG